MNIPLVDLKKYGKINLQRKRPKTGLAPGSLIYTGKVYSDKVHVEVIDYTDNRLQEVNILDVNELNNYNNPDTVTWINIQGLHDVSIIAKIGEMLGIHPLTLEDILDTQQRPKVEEYDDYLYISLKMINHAEKHNKIEVEQISIVMHKNFVICFQERPGDVFNDVRSRLRNGKGRARKRGVDYLGYMLLDIILDYYFETLDEVWNQIEYLEEIVVQKPERIKLTNIQVVRKDLIQLRRYMYPVRDVVHALSTRNVSYFQESTLMYLRDSHDHAVQVVENLDTYREILTSVMDLYLSQLSMKMNEVMKVLTIIATIFIPLTFLAGIYGMNFEHFPELTWQWAYPTGFYILSGAIVVIMLAYMKTKRWL